jgi:hypothetical protein
LTGKTRLLPVQKGKKVKNGQESKTRMGKRRFVLVLDKQSVERVLLGNCAHMQQ